ncbi:hypothetical protein TcasGA2_TC010274 [Tribolium castaneum]|uniref:Transposable element P transposase-like C-terminal domain-containing protein n=1 Tax=Tribolium castaneum TaxID=7070 RepID=D7EJK1_TRICA|nr:hypothetical protein TcasGA2_TC010274 [Tribolium castaneum]
MPDDYKRDLKGELLNFPTKPILKPTAVPSFNIPSRPEGMTSPSAREKRIKKRQSKKLVTETLAEPPRKILPEVESLPLPEQKTEKDILLERHTTLQKQYEDLKKMFEEQNKTIREHKAQIVKLEKSLEKLLQDFSIETKGFNNHPSPMDAIYRIRMIILGKNPGVVQKNLNTSDFDADEHIVAKVLNQTISLPSRNTDEQTQTDLSDTISVSSSCSTTTGAVITPEIIRPATSQCSESDGLEYLAGWVAKKFKNKYPTLGTYTYKMQSQHVSKMPS